MIVYESDNEDFSRGNELSFYEECFTHHKPRRKDTPYPSSAKIVSRRLYDLYADMTVEMPIWNGDKEDIAWENSSTESEQASKFSSVLKLRSPFADLPGQEYLDDIYEALAQSGNPRLLQSLENFIATTSDTLSQKNSENERLDAALRRATEKNSENARNLEEEMEQQISMLERKIREEEKRRAEKAILDAQLKMEEKDKEISAIKEKLEENRMERPTPDNENEEELKEKDLENETLRSRLRECQTQLAVFRTEIAQLKSEYDEQGDRLSRERQTVLRCVEEQESLTRQLQLLHEANRKLHDTNDDLRAVLENKLRSDDDSLSPAKRHSIGSPMGAYKKNPLTRSFDSQSSVSSRSAVATPTIKTDDDYSTMSSPPFRPIESEFNESSLMSELMAADEQGEFDDDIETEGILNTSMRLPESVLPVNNIETDYVDADAEGDPEFVESEELKEAFKGMTGRKMTEDDLKKMPEKEKEQLMEQLRILCDTNRRLSESNDELREALGLLTNKAKEKKSSRSSSRSSHSDYMSSPSRTNSRSSSRNSRLSRTDRPSSSSSPRHEVRDKRKKSRSTTPSVDQDDIITCECGTDLEKDVIKCTHCGKLQNIVSEDVVEPIVVKDDKSEPWLDPVLFPDENCMCGGDTEQPCDSSKNIKDRPDGRSNQKDVSIQADLTHDDTDQNEPNTSLHVCEGESCICCEGDDVMPLDKSVQVSDVLLDSSREKLNLEPDSDPVKSVIEDEVVVPDSESHLHSEQDLNVEGNCPDCNHPIDYSETFTGRCECRNNQKQGTEPMHSAAKKDNEDLQKTDNPGLDLKTSFPDFSDVTSNYTDRETDVRTHFTDPATDGTDSLANAAKIRQGNPSTTQDESASDTTSGINSSYSVIQNIDEELSMFAHQRESDEEVDEDDMTIGELQRIKEMTSSDSDLESDLDLTYGDRPEKTRAETTDQNSNENVDLGEPERMYKLVLAGDAAVGKSSFILRLCKNRFFPSLNSTLGVDFQMKTMVVDGHTIALQLWDTAGQERFRSIAKSYFRRVDGVLLLYDVTSETSFLNVRDWMESIQESSNKPVPIMLCGNKIDLRSIASSKGMNVITTDQGQRLAKEIDAFFIETSARNNNNITEAVLKLARKLQSLEDQEIRNGGVKLGENAEPKKKPGCC